MSLAMVFVVYGSSMVLALAALYFLRARAWYWHFLGVLLAVGLGFMPSPPVPWQGPAFDLALGFVFVFLLVWGVGGMLAFRTHHPRHA